MFIIYQLSHPPQPTTTTPSLLSLFSAMSNEPTKQDHVLLNSFTRDALAQIEPLMRNVVIRSSSVESEPDYSAEILAKLAATCPELTSLRLMCAESNVDEAICVVARGCPNLQAIDFVLCNVSDVAINEIAKCCKALKTLRLAGLNTAITDASIVRIAHGCPELVSLTLNGCTNVTSPAIEEIANHCKHLSKVDIRGVRVDDTCVIALASNCPGLTELRLG